MGNDCLAKRWLGIAVGPENQAGNGAAAPTYTITGEINPVTEGVTITLTGDASDSTTTDVNGLYTLSGVVAGSYTVTPTKTYKTFTPESTGVSVVDANKSADFAMSGGTLITPVYHNWNGETPGAAPSHCTYGTDLGDSPMIVTTANPSGWTESISGTVSGANESALCNLGGTFGPEDPGIRWLMLARNDGNATTWAYCGLSNSSTNYDGVGTGSRIIGRIQENVSPDGMQHDRISSGVTDFSEDYTGAGTNNSTGGVWNYYRYEQLVSGNTTWSVFSEAGVERYTITRAYQGTSGVFPVGLRYFVMLGIPTLPVEVAQIWVGRSTDAWPSLPMSPMSNL